MGVDILPNPHGSFGKGGVLWRDMDKAGSGSSPCCRDDEVGELLVIWGKEARAGWPLGDHWSQGCLSPEVVDLFLEGNIFCSEGDEVALVCGSSVGEGASSNLSNLSKCLCGPPGPKGL